MRAIWSKISSRRFLRRSDVKGCITDDNTEAFLLLLSVVTCSNGKNIFNRCYFYTHPLLHLRVRSAFFDSNRFNDSKTEKKKKKKMDLVSLPADILRLIFADWSWKHLLPLRLVSKRYIYTQLVFEDNGSFVP